jgi:hypothetical protein
MQGVHLAAQLAEGFAGLQQGLRGQPAHDQHHVGLRTGQQGRQRLGQGGAHAGRRAAHQRCQQDHTGLVQSRGAQHVVEQLAGIALERAEGFALQRGGRRFGQHQPARAFGMRGLCIQGLRGAHAPGAGRWVGGDGFSRLGLRCGHRSAHRRGCGPHRRRRFAHCGGRGGYRFLRGGCDSRLHRGFSRGRRRQRQPHTHAHLAQHGAVAFVEVQAHRA